MHALDDASVDKRILGIAQQEGSYQGIASAMP
jgi:hypothetical protein